MLGNQVSAVMKNVLGRLTDREREILCRRYGLCDDHPQTLNEIGSECKLTRERVRQIQHEALLRLREYLRESGVAG